MQCTRINIQTCEWNGRCIRNASLRPLAACENTTNEPNAGDGKCADPYSEPSIAIEVVLHKQRPLLPIVLMTFDYFRLPKPRGPQFDLSITSKSHCKQLGRQTVTMIIYWICSTLFRKLLFPCVDCCLRFVNNKKTPRNSNNFHLWVLSTSYDASASFAL